MKENRERGNLAETDFQRRLDENINDSSNLLWNHHPTDTFDFEILDVDTNKKFYIDVKSTEFSHKFTNKNSKTQSFKIGRFQLAQSQRHKDFYLALYIRFKHRVLFLGLIHSKEFGNSKYLSLHKLKTIVTGEIQDILKAEGY